MTTESQRLVDLLKNWTATGSDHGSLNAMTILEAAEQALADGSSVDRSLLVDYLEITGDHVFLKSLTDRFVRERWAETAAEAVLRADYRLHDMLLNRVTHEGDKSLFTDMGTTPPSHFSYRLVGDRVRSYAAAFYKLNPTPRVAILASNSVDSACCDLACLCHDILVTPLNIHFPTETIAEIFDRLEINIAVTDNADLYERLLKVRASARHPFELLLIDPYAADGDAKGTGLRKVALKMSASEVNAALEKRPRMAMDDVATVMFTSGSTGRPKGICFSQFNLVSKRFARAAALPSVGDDERLICFLPFFHTFGRYFELLGTIYWRGTYFFPGNPSAETLLNLMPQVNPTGLISVPLRWLQIQERCLEAMDKASSADQRQEIFRSVVGERLHWGLSAAGYLPPKVFSFFNQHGVDLCSGFGMTEATGGITMTPPGEYQKNSIGAPLPGIQARQAENGEMQIAGWYVARYLDELPESGKVPVDFGPDPKYWLPTGDLFRELPNGHYEIVDRLKDIYKNNRGQTVAPRKVEKKFERVPGIKTTFLVGDARAYNVLLIVPDREDPVLKGLVSEEATNSYFSQIASNANKDLAPYERVVNFAILDREFDVDREELTAKGSFRRKKIEENFASVIGELYRGDAVVFRLGELEVRVPRWFFRDVGILENDLEATGDGLTDFRRELHLPIQPGRTEGWYRVGDLEYELPDDSLDLGLITRRAFLWVGNPALVRFCPCKEGWEASTSSITHRPRFPADWPGIESVDGLPEFQGRDPRLARLNKLSMRSLAADSDVAVAAVSELGIMLGNCDERLDHVLSHRLEALAYHPEFEVRTAAYQVLLLDKPSKDYSHVLPAFIESGLPFLNDKSISALAATDIQWRRLEAFRQRLHTYRTTLSWPVKEETRLQFDKILRLLTDFARYHGEYYDTIRAELAAWILHRDDPALSRQAEGYLHELEQHYETNLAASSQKFTEDHWSSLVVLGDELNDHEIERLHDVICGTTFIRQSVMLGFGEHDFDLDQIAPQGIWISKILSRRHHQRYRVSIGTNVGKHFDLQVILSRDVHRVDVLETIYWLMTISGYPYGTRVASRLGCFRPDLLARSLVYQGDLTVWEKVREFSTRRLSSSSFSKEGVWRRLLVRGMAVLFRGWNLSGRRIVPGAVAPENVVVPEQDYRKGSVITSITGWKPYASPLDLVRPMLQNFFRKTIAHYPWSKSLLDVSWIFDACIEELGVEQGREFLEELHAELEHDDSTLCRDALLPRLESFLTTLSSEYYVRLVVRNAIGRYSDWTESTSNATSAACEQLLVELRRLYRFDKLDETARYYLYRHTYFANAGMDIRETFDRLLRQMFARPEVPATQMIELSELQGAIEDPADRQVFSRLIFPHASPSQQLELMAVGESEERRVIVRTEITDNRNETYTVRTPVEPAEIGELYRLYFKAGFPKTVTEQDRFLVVIDNYQQIIGGLCYQHDSDDVVHLDGSTVVPSLSGRGIGSALLEDFCSRMTNEGVRVVKTHFLLRNFYTKRGFEVDERWGALVRFLETD